MKQILFYLAIVANISLIAQEKETDYFTLYMGGEKHLKPTKYILFDPLQDKKKYSNDILYFFIKGERFTFSNHKHRIDSCNIGSVKKINFESAEKLLDKEYEFHKKKIEEFQKSDIKLPMPITKIHPYFKVYIVEKLDSMIIKYEVDWEYSHSY